MLKYIRKHWRGELSMALSLWINVFLINICIRLFEKWLRDARPIENPVVASQVTMVYVFIAVAIIYPWQIVGLWRSSNRHIEETKTRFWAGVVKFLIILGAFGTIWNLNISWPLYKDIYQIGFGEDKFANYRVELINDGSLIHLQGRLGFGISKQVKQLIFKNPNVKGIILDSIGGYIYEGRELSKIILFKGLDTYTIKGCYSACGTAFISGNKRYICRGANLAFHQYHSVYKNIKPYVDMTSEQQKDIIIFQRQGINKDFIDKIFGAEKDDLWYPTIDEMIDAGVIHGVVNPSNLKPVKYGEFDSSVLEKALLEISAFATIKKYDPKTYSQIIENMTVQMKKGASLIEVKQVATKYLQPLGTKSLPKASNKTLIMFARETINILAKLEEIDPILCLKNLYPAQYGSIMITEYLSNEELMPMMDALSLAIKDSYELKNTSIDKKTAEKLFEEIAVQLGDDFKYLDAQMLENRKDYSKSCKAVIKFYELILSNNTEITGNALRYAFSQ